jgi:hypothetical protein
MLNEILSECERVREKDTSTKNSIKNLLADLKSNLQNLSEELEEIPSQMTVIFINL